MHNITTYLISGPICAALCILTFCQKHKCSYSSPSVSSDVIDHVFTVHIQISLFIITLAVSESKISLESQSQHGQGVLYIWCFLSPT